MFKLNDMFFMKWLKILIVKVAEFGNPSTKNIDRQRYFIYYVFWSILSQMRHVCCELFPKKCTVERSKCLVQGHNMRACTGFELMTLGSWVRSFNTRGGLNFGFGRDVPLEIWKWTHFKPNFPKILTHFYTKNLDFRQNLTQFFEIFRNFWKFFNPKFMKFGQLGDKFEKILKSDPSLYKFCNWKRGHSYTRRLILWPISAARPHTHFCTKNPPGFNTLNLYALWWKFPCQLYRILHLASQNMYFGVSYFVKILWQDTQNMLLWSHCKIFYS